MSEEGPTISGFMLRMAENISQTSRSLNQRDAAAFFFLMKYSKQKGFM
jgi:hypothetical protein